MIIYVFDNNRKFFLIHFIEGQKQFLHFHHKWGEGGLIITGPKLWFQEQILLSLRILQQVLSGLHHKGE